MGSLLFARETDVNPTTSLTEGNLVTTEDPSPTRW